VDRKIATTEIYFSGCFIVCKFVELLDYMANNLPGIQDTVRTALQEVP